MISTKSASENPSASIHDNLDSDSNVGSESNPHRERHFSSKPSADEERMISTKPVPKNAISSIRGNANPDSNVMKESDLHSEKHPSLKNFNRYRNTELNHANSVECRPLSL
jgi:hypothetical protein